MPTNNRRAMRVALSVLVLGWLGCASTKSAESTGEFVDDAAITAKVKTAFVGDPVVSAFAASVETYKGVVQLSGFVNSQEEKDKAEELARGVNGVKSVTNSLIVKTK